MGYRHIQKAVMLSFLVANCSSMQRRSDKAIAQNNATIKEIEATREYIAMADMAIADKSRVYQTLDKCEASIDKSSAVLSSCAEYPDKIWFWRKVAAAGWVVAAGMVAVRVFLR